MEMSGQRHVLVLATLALWKGEGAVLLDSQSCTECIHLLWLYFATKRYL